MNHTCAPPYIATCRACDIELAEAEGPAVGYGCGNGCGGVAYFPSEPGDFCTTCSASSNGSAPVPEAEAACSGSSTPWPADYVSDYSSFDYDLDQRDTL